MFLFAIPLRRITARSCVDALGQIFLRHSYIPQLLITDQGSQFISNLMKEATSLFDIELRHATVKHPQTIGLLERSHAGIKKTLKIYENRGHTNWHQYVDYAVFANNNAYNPDTRSTPVEMFSGQAPMKAHDMRFGVNKFDEKEMRFEPTAEIQDRLRAMWQTQKDHLVANYIKHKEYFDQFAKANPLKLHSHVLLLNPALDTQKQIMDKMEPKWLALYRVEQIFSDQNYLVRRVKTNHTQNVHRIRLKPIIPREEVLDIEEVDRNKFIQDPEWAEQYLEPNLFDRFRERILRENQDIDPADPDWQQDLQDALPTVKPNKQRFYCSTHPSLSSTHLPQRPTKKTLTNGTGKSTKRLPLRRVTRAETRRMAQPKQPARRDEEQPREALGGTPRVHPGPLRGYTRCRDAEPSRGYASARDADPLGGTQAYTNADPLGATRNTNADPLGGTQGTNADPLGGTHGANPGPLGGTTTGNAGPLGGTQSVAAS